MPVTVTMQLNVGANEAGDWANQLNDETASATGFLLPLTVAVLPAHGHEVMIRLHDLRGAVDAMKSEVYGPTLAHTNSSRADLGYGDPIAYRGMRFMTRAI